MQKKVNQNAYKKICLRHATTKLLAKLRKYDEISSQIWKHFKSTLKQPPSPPHFQCWWIVLGSHMLANIIGVNIEVGGRGAKGNEEEFGCVFQQTIFPSKLRIWKSFDNLFCRWVSEKHISLKLLVSVFRGILWPNLDSVGDSKIIYDNNPICDVIELALHDVTADTTCQNGKCTDNCQNALKIVY